VFFGGVSSAFAGYCGGGIAGLKRRKSRIMASALLLMMDGVVANCMYVANARKAEQERGREWKRQRQEMSSWAGDRLHIIISTSLTPRPFPRHRHQQRPFRKTHGARTGSAHCRCPPSPTDQCLFFQVSSLCSQHFQIAAAICDHLSSFDLSHGRLHWTRPSLVCPIPPASQSSHHPIACYTRVGGHGWEGSSRFGCGESCELGHAGHHAW
jgi:hypothetical protein